MCHYMQNDPKIETEPQRHMDRVKQIWYLSPMRAAKVQASLRIRAVSPEPSLLAHTSSESRGTFRQKARSLAPLNGWAVKICHDGMLEDTNLLDAAHIRVTKTQTTSLVSSFVIHCTCKYKGCMQKLRTLASIYGWADRFQPHFVVRHQNILQNSCLDYQWTEQMYYKISLVMRKTVFALSEQQRRRSACASAQSWQRLCCSLPR